MSRRKGAPWRHRPYHRAFSRLSAAARDLSLAGFRAGEPTTTIAEAITRVHGETIAVASLNRYREWWTTAERPAVEAAVKAEELLKAFKDHPTPELESLITQLLQAQRLAAMTEDKRPDPNELGWLDVEHRKLRLQERALALREKELERRTHAAAGAVEKELKKTTVPPATIERIKREVYGIAS